jgi:hypothetical protein
LVANQTFFRGEEVTGIPSTSVELELKMYFL